MILDLQRSSDARPAQIRAQLAFCFRDGSGRPVSAQQCALRGPTRRLTDLMFQAADRSVPVQLSRVLDRRSRVRQFDVLLTWDGAFAGRSSPARKRTRFAGAHRRVTAPDSI
jgi:hypothetical protein